MVPGASGDCSKFVKEVAKKLFAHGFEETDSADEITRHIRVPNWSKKYGWIQLENDIVEIKKYLDVGWLVIAGASGKDLGQPHGHVVVAISSKDFYTGSHKRKSLYASWGKLDATGEIELPMSYAYASDDLSKVDYVAIWPWPDSP